MSCVCNTERKHLLSPVQFAELARPTSMHLEDDEVMAFITECEDMFIIPTVGYDVLSAAIDYVNDNTLGGKFDEDFDPEIYLNGGAFDYNHCGCDGASEWCAGLRKALAYYVYAKMSRADGSIIARDGLMRHNDQYASHVEPNLKQYNDVMEVAEQYLASCQRYAKMHRCGVRMVNQSRATIKAIGR